MRLDNHGTKFVTGRRSSSVILVDSQKAKMEENASRDGNIIPSVHHLFKYSQLLITRTFKGNLKWFQLSGFRVIESWEQMTGNL